MNLISEDYLMHYGVKGMKWGVRHDSEPSGRRASNMRFREEARNAKRDNRNAIRSANQASRDRRKAAAQKNLQDFKNNYGSRSARKQSNAEYREEVKAAKAENRNAIRSANQESRNRIKEAGKKNIQDFKDIYSNASKSFSEKAKGLKLSPEQKKTAKKIAIGAAVVAGVALASYGGYKVSKLHQTRATNKAIVAKYLQDNPGFDIAIKYGKGADQTRISPTHTILNTATIHDTKYGPSMRVTKSEVYKPSSSTGKNPLLFKKEATSKVIGVNGKPRHIKKSDIRKYKKMYNDVYKQYVK